MKPVPRAIRAAAALMMGVAMCGAVPTLASGAEPTTLTVTFQGLKTPSGAVLMQLVAGEAAYVGKADGAAQAVVKVTGDSASTTFEGLAPGRYAVKAFHDVDGDGKMASNPFGIPTEPFAFSNNARGNMGPPRWSDAAFEVKAGANLHTIDID